MAEKNKRYVVTGGGCGDIGPKAQSFGKLSEARAYIKDKAKKNNGASCDWYYMLSQLGGKNHGKVFTEIGRDIKK